MSDTPTPSPTHPAEPIVIKAAEQILAELTEALDRVMQAQARSPHDAMPLLAASAATMNLAAKAVALVLTVVVPAHDRERTQAEIVQDWATILEIHRAEWQQVHERDPATLVWSTQTH